jgi:dihydroflavonol-4-reductase
MNLITGATGHIGNVMTRQMLARDEKVRVLQLPGEDCHSLDGLDVERVEGNVLDIDSLRHAFQQIDVVYHLASLVTLMPGKQELVRRVNVDGTRNVLQAAREMGVRRVVYTSSIHALGRPPHDVAIDESIPFDAENPAGEYDRTKAEASLIVQQAARDGQDVLIVCPTGVIGPYDFRGSEMGTLLWTWARQKVNFLVDGGYDWVDVRDVSQGEVLAAERGQKGETYILSGEHAGLLRLWGWVKEVTGLRSMHITVPFSLAKAATPLAAIYYRLTKTKPQFTEYSLGTIASNSNIRNAKARRELGFSPRGLQETVTDTIRWWNENYRQIATTLRSG